MLIEAINYGFTILLSNQDFRCNKDFSTDCLIKCIMFDFTFTFKKPVCYDLSFVT